MDNSKSVFIAYLGNPYLDSRVINLIESLESTGYSVKISGFDFKSEDFNSQKGKITIHRIKKGRVTFFFYLQFSLKLMIDLLKSNAGIYFAEDIYTLPLVSIFGRIRKAKIFYNSREIYAHIGGLREKRLIQSLIANTEKRFIYKVDHVLVTGEMDADYLKGVYNLQNIIVLRNLPLLQDIERKQNLRKMLSIPDDRKILIYQGVILEGRGIPFLIKLLEHLPNINFIIIGDGEFKQEFEEIANRSLARDRIHFIGAVNHTELFGYTAAGDIGVSVIENISISYYYALPNKLFEYIMSGLPVISSDLPQMKNIIDKYEVGVTINPENFEYSLHILSNFLNDETKLKSCAEKTKLAREELNWQKEFEKLNDVL